MKNLSPHSVTLPFAHPEPIGQPLLLFGAFNMAKGYVYFFRHIGTTPVKIGMTCNETVSSRFDSFNTFSPYGGEILGFIESEKPYELEHKIHEQFKEKRLNGEFFEISNEVVESLILKFSNKKIIALKHEFNRWLTNIDCNSVDFSEFSRFFDKREKVKEEVGINDSIIIANHIQKILIEHNNVEFITISQLSKICANVYKTTIRQYLNEHFVRSKRAIRFHSINGVSEIGIPYKIRVLNINKV